MRSYPSTPPRISWLAFGLLARIVSTASSTYQNNNGSLTWSDGYLDTNYICVYPTHGQYALLQRVLFYALLVFALLARNHEWLVAAALAASMTFAGTAAIHAIAFAIVRPDNGSLDTDLRPLIVILSSSSLIATPLLNWSSTLRRVRARPIILTWYILVTVGYAALVFSIKLPKLRHTSCSTSPPVSPLAVFDATFLAVFNCPFPCDDVSATPAFRTGSKALLQVIDEVPDELYTDATPGPLKFALVTVVTVWQFVLFFGMAQTLYLVLAGRRSPTEFRHAFFRLMLGKRLKEGRLRPKRYIYLGPAILASVIYLVAIVFLIAAPPLFVINIVITEYIHAGTLSEEEYNAVGQWAPYASALLAILAAVLVRYVDPWSAALKAIFKTLVLRPWNHMRGRTPSPSHTTHPSHDLPVMTHSAQPYNAEASDLELGPASPSSIEKSASKSLPPTLAQLSSQPTMQYASTTPRPLLRVSTRHSVTFALKAQFIDPFPKGAHNVAREWRDFKAWVKDPIAAAAVPQGTGARGHVPMYRSEFMSRRRRWLTRGWSVP
ncbi:MAG: hypothetical protein M1833_001389 [Piccolia ochrophora]|nr:MAG: hypothetical protein M1833_001389 [Piccolia ochrophora]